MDFQLSLSTEPVGSASTQQPLATTPDATVAEVLQLMRAEKAGACLICEASPQGDRLVGILTERDMLKLMAAGANLELHVMEVIDHLPATVESGASIATAIRRMTDGGFRRLPIVDLDGKPLAMISVSEIVHYLVQHFPQTIYNLPPDGRPGPATREGA